MPRFDGTGPRGMGPMTGGRRGFCNAPGARAMERPYGYGYGYGRGRGAGYGYATPAFSGYHQELDSLKSEIQSLKDTLNRIESQLNEIK